jgi:putative ABC transport system ATP-binding protein
MVMVTHDVALKNYANRIIWMRDGKIQRIEKVAKSKREETYRFVNFDIDL